MYVCMYVLPESVRQSGVRACAGVVTKFSEIDRFPFSIRIGIRCSCFNIIRLQ